MTDERLVLPEIQSGQADATTLQSKMTLPALVFASAVSQLGFVIANPILLDIAQSFHLPLPLVAQGRMLQSLGSATMGLGATLIADRLPRRSQLLLGLCVMAIAGLALGAIKAFPAWLCVQVISGAASGLVALACSTAIGDYVLEARRGAAMGYTAAGMGLAWLLGLPVVGFAASAWGWRTVYTVLGGGSAIVCWVAVAVALPAFERKTARAQDLLAGWREMLARRSAKGLLLGDALTGTAWAGFLVYIGPFFGVVYTMRSSGVGTMLALASVIGTFGTLCAAPLAAWFGQRRLLLGASVVAAAAIMVPLGMKITPLLTLAALTPYIFLNCVRFPTSGTMALSMLPAARGTMMAARSFTISTAGMMGALIGGLLLAVGGFGAIGLGWSILTFAGAYAYTQALAATSSGQTTTATPAGTSS